MSYEILSTGLDSVALFLRLHPFHVSIMAPLPCSCQSEKSDRKVGKVGVLDNKAIGLLSNEKEGKLPP